MKLQYKKIEQTGNVQQEESFTVDPTKMSKFFQIIQNGMYSDKIKSVVREIMSNAYDAHVASDCSDKAFCVDVPSSLDPSFRVRDYGNGMSHEFMTTKYTQALHSTKDESNEEIGGFGLGRLSPFSYTDSYSVTCFQGGVSRVYSIHKNNEGGPSVSLLGEVDTDEPDGVEVTVPVDRVDISKFSKAVEFYYPGFPVPPKVYGTNLDPIEMLYDTPFGCFSKQIDSPKVLVGCILYPLDLEIFNGYETKHKVKTSGLILKAEIGEVSVAVSRENISYEKETIEYLKDLTFKAFRSVKEQFEKELNRHNTMFEAFVEVSKLRTSIIEKKKVRWRGRPLPDSVFHLGLDSVEMVSVKKGRYGRSATYQKSVNSYSVNISSYSSKEKYAILVEDKTDKKSNVRCLQKVKHAVSQGVLPENIIWFTFTGEKYQRDEFVTLTTELPFDVVFVKDLHDPGVQSSTSKSVFVTYKRRKFTLTPGLFNEGGIYYKMYRGFEETPCTYKDSLEDLSGLKVVGVNKPQWKKFENDPNWTELHKWCEDYRNKNKKVLLEYAKSFSDSKEWSCLISSVKLQLVLAGVVPPQPPTKFSGSFLAPEAQPTKTREDYKREHNNLIDQYPMLRYYSGSCPQDFKDYIKLVQDHMKLKGN